MPIKPTILFLSLLCFTLSARCQKDTDAQLILQGVNEFTFRPFSIELTDESFKRLGELTKRIQYLPEMSSSYLWVLQAYACEKELIPKPYLNAVRAQVILDHLVSTLPIPREKIFIQVIGSLDEDPDCNIGNNVAIYVRKSL
ncbi:MAG: hypothetical protein AAF824_01190 [Bacteroidota bacterium]